ncbi:MAG TPA: hypothetical protein VFW83_02670 [Bryobacteraceae bacterium]|nr:hypothetical protein [Bryobacteraceae bacterium]
MARRILSDASRHVYFGYEMILKPQAQAGEYVVSFRALDPQADGLILDGWTPRPPPSYPQPRILQEGETISFDLENDKSTGESIVDEVLIAPPQPRTRLSQIWSVDLARLMAYGSMLNKTLRERGLPPVGSPARPSPPSQATAAFPPVRMPPLTIAGTPQKFTAADAEFRILGPKLTVRGGPEGAPVSGLATGRLIYFYLPGRGRYILSLVPRPELGFLRAGEVRGGSLIWTAGGSTFSVQTSAAIAPGSAPYFIYVLHDAGWQPVKSADRGRLLTGSVGPEELELLQKDKAK